MQAREFAESHCHTNWGVNARSDLQSLIFQPTYFWTVSSSTSSPCTCSLMVTVLHVVVQYSKQRIVVQNVHSHKTLTCNGTQSNTGLLLLVVEILSINRSTHI